MTGRVLASADGRAWMTKMKHDGAVSAALEKALQEAEDRYIAANPKSRASFVEACESMPGGNTRSILFYPPFPVTIVKGEGSRLWDVDGHVYRDFLGEYTAGLYGHSHPVISRAVQDALASGILLCGPNRYEAQLAQLISGRFPSCELVRFCNSGTEANLMAISTARVATGRTHLVVFEGGYHGGVLDFSHGPARINAPFPVIVGEYNDIEGTVAAIERSAGELAAILVEPMAGAGGAVPGTSEFLLALRELATRHGIVLIFDEVMTSRLSAGGLQAKLSIVPDLTTLGKYIGGGLTFGAFGGRAELMTSYDPRRADAAHHSGTFNNNVLTMAAGVAGLKEIFTREASESLNATGDRFRERLNDLGRRNHVPVQVTGVGSIMNIHFQQQPVRKPPDTAATPTPLRALFHLEMMMRGCYLARRGFMSLSVTHGEEDFEKFAARFEEFLHRYRSILAQ
jgi:glutamate-1-semialdehyde 2,1-aminomutase